MAKGPPYPEGFLEHIVDVHFGGDWIVINAQAKASVENAITGTAWDYEFSGFQPPFVSTLPLTRASLKDVAQVQHFGSIPGGDVGSTTLIKVDKRMPGFKAGEPVPVQVDMNVFGNPGDQLLCDVGLTTTTMLLKAKNSVLKIWSGGFSVPTIDHFGQVIIEPLTPLSHAFFQINCHVDLKRRTVTN